MLPLVLLLVLALELLAHGALLMARQEAAASRIGAGLVQARVASESGLHASLSPVGARYDGIAPWSVLPGAAGAVGEGRFAVAVRRLDREVWLWESEGRVEGRPWRVRTGMPGWLPDPVERLRAFGAVVVVGAGAPIVGEARIETSGLRRDGPDLDVGPCSPWRAALDTLYRGVSTPPIRVEGMDGGREPALGPLGRDELLAWIGGGAGGGDFGAWAVAGDVRMEGGDHARLVVAGGDVELVGGRFEGVVLAGGRVILGDGAELAGVVRAYGGIEISPGARIVGSGCRALLALSGGLERWARPLTLHPGPFGLF